MRGNHMLKKLSLLTLLCLGCANSATPRRPASAHPEDHFSHLPPGGRRSLHGMVLFGRGKYFLEHIPMLQPPHDFQIIAEVKLSANGQLLARDFSQQGFTLKPAQNFSLNDYVAGRLRKFSGSIHDGSFEQGGPVLKGLENVQVEVTEYKVIRQLPGEDSAAALTFRDGANEFETNVIRPEQNFQRIRNITTAKELWCVRGPDFFEPCN